MKVFTRFITEAKNVHMEHLEDAVWNEGSAGVAIAISFLESVAEMLQGHSKTKVNVTVKWDGAPAVFAGIHPETRKFFVATKSLFNVTPKVNYTNADIDKNHGHAAELANKLKVALKYLGKLGIRGILQGDIMFTDDTSSATIDGDKYLTFTPNTITYAVPDGSDAASEISNAKIGVVWHTKYTGKTIKALKASFNPRVSSLAKTRDVWSKDADFKDTSGTSTFTSSETTTINSLIANIRSAKKSAGRFLNQLVAKPTLISELKIYGNALVRQGAGEAGSAAGFINYIGSKMQTSIDSLKTDSAKERKEAIKKELLAYLSENSTKLDSVFALHAALAEAKLFIIRKLEQVKQIGTFIKTSNGFRVTSPEGFVAVDRVSNTVLKLVDRLEFSKANFTVPKNWDK